MYSHSRLSQYENCPKKFEYRYVLGITADTESIEGFMGKRVHEVLERLYRVAQERGVPSLARVLHRFRALWDEHFDPQRVRVVREGTWPDLYRETGERCLVNYYRRHYPFDGDETLGIEQPVSFALDEAGAYRVRGIVDRLGRARDGALEIHDYKTSARIPRQSHLDRDRQLALYQLAVGERLAGGRPVRLVWHYLAHDQVRTSQRSPEQLASLRRRTMRLIDRIRAETEWVPKTGPLCRWCEYRDICPTQQRPVRAPAPAAPPPLPAEPSGQLLLL